MEELVSERQERKQLARISGSRLGRTPAAVAWRRQRIGRRQSRRRWWRRHGRGGRSQIELLRVEAMEGDLEATVASF
jgi:hypothetical protein